MVDISAVLTSTIRTFLFTRPKILHIITSLKIGGAESALLNLLSKFEEQNKVANQKVVMISF